MRQSEIEKTYDTLSQQEKINLRFAIIPGHLEPISAADLCALMKLQECDQC